MQADTIDVVDAGTSEVNGRYKMQKGPPNCVWWRSGTHWYEQVDSCRYCIYFYKAFDAKPDRWCVTSMQDEFVLYFADGSAGSLPSAGWQVATGQFALPGSEPAPTLMQVHTRYGLRDPEDSDMVPIPTGLPPTYGGEADRRLLRQQRHEEGTCKPCAFFQTRGDGCSLAENCSFCHLCTQEDVKEKKRLLKRQSRAARRRAKWLEEDYQIEEQGMCSDTWQGALSALVFGNSPVTPAFAAGGSSPGRSG